MEEKKIRFIITNVQLFAEDPDADADKGNESETDPAQKYIDTIADMKKTMVPKEKLEQANAENKQLLRLVIDGSPMSPETLKKLGIEAEPDPVDVKALREDLFGPNRKELNNLETVEKALQLREAIMKDGGKDPFLGTIASPTAEDLDGAEKVADFLQDCVDKSEGDSSVFTALMGKGLRDDPIIAAAKNKRVRAGK